MKPSEILSKAADLIEPEGAWTTGELARNASGKATAPYSEEAVCWCAAGAINRATVGLGGRSADGWLPANHKLQAFLGGLITTFNDAPERTQSEVVSALRQASKLAEGEGE